jgi:STE24 endopeptidase
MRIRFLGAALALTMTAATVLPSIAAAAEATAPTAASAAAIKTAPASDALADSHLAKFHVREVDDAWRAALPHDVDAATKAYMDRLPADVVARSDAYFEGGYWLQLWNFLAGLVIAAVLLGSRRSARLRDWAHRVGRGPFRGDAIFGGAYALLSSALSLPLDIYQGFVREHQYSMATQGFGAWIGEHVMGMGIGVIVSMIIVPLLYIGIRKAGERWWLFGTGFTVTMIIVGLLIGPTVIEPLFNTYKPVQDQTVKTAVLAMAHANGVPADNVYEFDASRQTTRVSANVSGIFGTAAVRLNDNLLNRSSLSEIRAVMGHELGHYVMNHIYKAIAELALLFLVGFAFTQWGMNRMLATRGGAWGLKGMGDVANLPLLAAVFSVFMFFATPVQNTLVRTQEIEADRFGLNLSREPLGEAEVDLKLTEYRKPDPGPIEEWVFFDHPSTRFRVHDAMRWRAAMQADGPGKPWAADAK